VSEDESRELCDRHVADRNYYTVCRFILSPVHAKHAGPQSMGLLHGTPVDTDAVFGILDLLESCVQQHRQRISAATQLTKTLTELVGAPRQPTAAAPAAVKH